MKDFDFPRERNRIKRHIKTTEPKRLNLLSAMEQIVEMSEDSNLSEEFLERAERYIKYVSKKMKLTSIQAILLSIFIDKNDDSNIMLSEIASYLGCRNVRMIRYLPDIDVLIKRKFIIENNCNRNISYRLQHKVVEAIKKNEPYVPKDMSNISCDELFQAFDHLFEQKDEGDINTKQLGEEINLLLNDNRQQKFTKVIQSYDFDTTSKILLVYFCHCLVNNENDKIDIEDIHCLFNDEKSTYRIIRRKLESQNNELIFKGLISNALDNGFADREIFSLTSKGKKELLSDLNINLNSVQICRDILPCKKIVTKKLFYNERERKQVRQLTSLLKPDKFASIQQRLIDCGMRQGFACLFYGEPGTGKTETALQIARLTGRDIMQVNVSDIKSKWVGESEKNIKGLFDIYRTQVVKADITPILLFNEADAIIGKRQKSADSAVEKMENSIQNIILQEMETLNGIMIATTNLTQNMDDAFERRFLYKIKFDRPCTTAKEAIWKSMIPAISEAEATELATSYNFSGGQIENIARKRMVQSILIGDEQIGIEDMREYCDNELISQSESRRKIGF